MVIFTVGFVCGVIVGFIVGSMDIFRVGFVYRFMNGVMVGLLAALLRRGVVGIIFDHCTKIPWRALIAQSCLSHISVGASLSAHVSICRPWRMQSLGVSVGCVK